MYGLPKSVCVVHVIPISVKCSFHMFCLCFCMSDVISSFRSFESWITGVWSPYVISLCDFAYYVFG